MAAITKSMSYFYMIELFKVFLLLMWVFGQLTRISINFMYPEVNDHVRPEIYKGF